MRRILFACLFLSAFLSAFAQSPQTGLYQLGAFDTPGFDTINRGNLNVHLSIPIINKPGRGGTGFNFTLNYDGIVWSPVSSSGVSGWSPTQNWGWTTDSTSEFGYVTYEQNILDCTSTKGLELVEFQDTNFVFHDKSGQSHPFGYSYTSTCGGTAAIPTGTGSFTISDNSQYTAVYRNGSNFTAFTRAGAQFTVRAVITFDGSAGVIPKAGAYTDTNGNSVSASSTGVFTDTLGTTALSVSGTAPNPVIYQYTDTTGTSRSITVNYTSYSVATSFGVSGVTEYTNTSVPLISSIVYPDLTSYLFTYESTPGSTSTVTGRLASITLPTGGVISYTYTGGSNGIESDGSPSGIKRTTTDGSTTYVRSAITTTGSTTTFTDASSNVTVSNYLESTLGYSYETSRSIYAGAATGTPLQQVTTCYVATSGCVGDSVAAPINYQITTLARNGVVIGTDTKQYSGGTIVSDSNGYFTQTTAYLNFTGANSISFSRVKSVTATVGSTQIALTSYSYDQTTPTATSGLPMHSAVTTARGNLTTVSPWLNTTNAVFGASTNTYYDTGSLLTSTTPNGTSTYGYDATGSYTTGLTPPTPSSGISLFSSATYDTNTGLALTGTDPNGVKTVYESYDSRGRPLEVDSIDSSSNSIGKTTHNYSANQVGVQVFQSASANADTETHYDGYGRVDRVAEYNGQSSTGWYEHDSCFDVNGRLLFKSYPFVSTGLGGAKSCSGAGDTYAYDALGRVLKITHADNTSITSSYNVRATQTIDENNVTRITQTDFMGRPTIVCEVTGNTMPSSGGAPASCGTDIAATGYATTYAYNLATLTTTVTQGAQTRVFNMDSLGRSSSVTEPESGTTTYSYAYNSTGLVVTRTRPKANQTISTVLTTTTTQYDTLNRPISISYSDGTPTKTYAYDTNASWVWTNFSPTNLKGRLYLAEQGVQGATGAATTYSYDSLGRVNSMHECLPSGCGNASYDRILNYIYDWQGNMLSSSDGAGVTTLYSSYTPAGEPGSITNSLTGSTHPLNLMYQPVYGANGPVSYRFGNGLSQYNTYTALGKINGSWICAGFPSQACDYQGGVSVYGFVTNWSGGNVTYFSDDVTAPGSSSKNLYMYDEFNRLKATSYGSGTTTFSYTYDRWGNRLSQAAPQGGPAPSYTFNTANNQVSTFTYDALGNVLNDGFHSYLYDAENNLIKVDAGSNAVYTYDALNRRVRQDLVVGSQEFVFNSNSQRVSIWNPATETQVQGQFYWGSKPIAFYTIASGQTFFQHQDWMGTERTRTTYNGAVAGTFSSLPFGDNYTVVSGTDTDVYHFASLDQDSTSSTSHAQFRQYSSTAGRWMSPDSFYGSYQARNPQSFNRYAYIKNNPIAKVDSSGLDACDDDDITCIDVGEGGGGGDGGGDGGGSGGGDAGSTDPCGPTDGSCVNTTTNPDPPVDTESGGDSSDSSQDPVNSGSPYTLSVTTTLLTTPDDPNSGAYTLYVNVVAPAIPAAVPFCATYPTVCAGAAAAATDILAPFAVLAPLLMLQGDNKPKPDSATCKKIVQSAKDQCTNKYADGGFTQSSAWRNCVRQIVEPTGCDF